MTLCLPSPSLESSYQTCMPIFTRCILNIPGPLKIPGSVPKVPPGPPSQRPWITGYQNVKKRKRNIVFVFHSKLNARANRIKMRVESRNVFLVENTKRVIHMPQPKAGRSMKCSDSCVFNVFHVKISNDRRNARTHGRIHRLGRKRIKMLAQASRDQSL